jgi:nucleoside phosphorylase/tetratricopeptide (TPR) repeat protein
VCQVDDGPVIVVLTALELEHRSIRQWLGQCRRVDHPSGTVFEVGRPPRGRGRIALAVTGEGNTAAAVLAERAIALFRPRALMFVGVAGALRDDIELGDVVVATKVYAYHGGAMQPDGFRARPRSWEAPHQLDQLARLVSRSDAWTALLPAEAGRPRVHFRPIAAGEVLLNARDDPLSAQLRHTYGDAVAIEMESAGMAQAAHLNGALPVLTVRGISDKADGHKHAADGDGWQPAAAGHAAAFALAVVAELFPASAAPVPSVAAPPSAVPRQLPGRGGALVGRAAQLSRLDEILLRPADDRARIAVVTGMAGSGKTALAVDWAHDAADAFPDGVLYADARGFGPDQPLDPREILAGFLRALGQSRAAEQGSLDERAARFRTALAGRRVLVLLDNVQSIEQVRPLLPGTASCAVLITSRERLRGLAVRYAAEPVELDRLPAAESVALLRATVGDRADADPDATERLAGHCAGLPLALRIAAEVVAARPHEGLAALVDDLDGSGTALDFLDTGDDPYSAVRNVLSWSYSALDERHAVAFRRLGLHPGGSVALPTAAALLDATPAQARVTLRRLVTAHLATEPAADRFQTHDLIRAYARELGGHVDDAATRLAALRRMVDQYLHTADRAGRVIMPHRYRVPLDGRAATEAQFADRASALRWFDEERHNLVDVCRLEPAALDSRRWQLAYVLRDYFYLTKHLDGWRESHMLAVAACVRLGDRRAEGMTRNNLGRALLEAGRSDAAEQEYRRAGVLLAEAGDEQGATDSRVNLASILRRRGRPEEALRHQRAALAYYRSAGVPRKVGITLRGIARAELALGRLAEAAGHAREALDRFTELGLDLDAAQTLTTLAQIHHRDGQAAAAEGSGVRAAELSARAGSDFERGRALHVLGAVAAGAGHTDVARQRWTEALEIFRRLGADPADAVEADLRRLDDAGPG